MKKLSARKTAFLLSGVLVFLILAGLCVYRLVTLNQKYPTPDVQLYAQGEPVNIRGLTVTVNKTEITEMETLDPDYVETATRKNGDPLTKGDTRILLVYTTIKNESFQEADSKGYTLTYNVRSHDFANAMDPQWFSFLNPITKVIPKPSETQEIIFPVPLYCFHFTEKRWADVENLPFEFVLTGYPEDKRIRLDVEKMGD